MPLGRSRNSYHSLLVLLLPRHAPWTLIVKLWLHKMYGMAVVSAWPWLSAKLSTARDCLPDHDTQVHVPRRTRR